MTTWPVGLGIVATVAGAIGFVVSFVADCEQRLARRLARPRAARPRPRARLLGPRPRRRRGHRRPVPGAARRHRRPGRAGDPARRARLRDHAAELPQQGPGLRRRRLRAEPGGAARRARPVAGRQPDHHGLAQGPPARHRGRRAGHQGRARHRRLPRRLPRGRRRQGQLAGRAAALRERRLRAAGRAARAGAPRTSSPTRACAPTPAAPSPSTSTWTRCWSARATSRRSTCSTARTVRRRTGRAAAAAAAAGDRQGRLPLRAERLHRDASAPASGTPHEERPRQDHDLKRGLGNAFGVRRSPIRPAARWLDTNLGGSGLLREELRHIFPRQLGVLPRRDRPVLLRRPRRDGHLPGAVLPGVGGAGRLRGLLRAARRRRDVRRLRLGAEPEPRRARRPAGAAGAPLGGARLRRRPDHPHAAHAPHGGVPAAAPHQLRSSA